MRTLCCRSVEPHTVACSRHGAAPELLSVTVPEVRTAAAAGVCTVKALHIMHGVIKYISADIGALQYSELPRQIVHGTFRAFRNLFWVQFEPWGHFYSKSIRHIIYIYMCHKLTVMIIYTCVKDQNDKAYELRTEL